MRLVSVRARCEQTRRDFGVGDGGFVRFRLVLLGFIKQSACLCEDESDTEVPACYATEKLCLYESESLSYSPKPFCYITMAFNKQPAC